MSLRAAAGSVEITPEVGTALSGWCFGPSTGVADPLFARALVLSDGSAPLVIVTADLIGLGTDLANRVRETIATDLGTERERVMIACSHTHSGPGAMPLRRWGPMDETYVERLEGWLAACALDAGARLEPVTIHSGVGEVRGINTNRRGDHGNRTDDTLPVIAVTSASGTPLAILYNVSCHPVAAHNDRNLISADFPGYAARGVAQAFPDAQAMFLLGAAGDINPVEFHSLELAERYGKSIAAEVISAVAAGTGQATVQSVGDTAAVLDCAATPVKLPVAPLPEAEWLESEVKRWSAEAQRLEDNGGPHSKIEDALIKAEWAAEALDVVQSGTARSHLEMEITALRIGDAAIVAVPGEPFVEIGLAIKEASPFAQTIVVGLANGSLCYLPTSDAYAAGGYETDFSAKVYGLYMLTPRAQSIIEQAAHRLLLELRDNIQRSTP